jgi:hypothetical protein
LLSEGIEEKQIRPEGSFKLCKVLLEGITEGNPPLSADQITPPACRGIFILQIAGTGLPPVESRIKNVTHIAKIFNFLLIPYMNILILQSDRCELINL